MFHLIAVLGALAGIALGAYAWLIEGTGVSGTPGALLALAGAAAVWITTLILALPAVRGGLHLALRVLAVIGAALTALAAWFLMQDAFVAAMVVACLALLFTSPAQRRART